MEEGNVPFRTNGWVDGHHGNGCQRHRFKGALTHKYYYYAFDPEHRERLQPQAGGSYEVQNLLTTVSMLLRRLNSKHFTQEKVKALYFLIMNN